MPLGGIDIVLLASAQECVGDVILRACRRHWAGRKCVFQDVQEKRVHSLEEDWVWKIGTASKEFFVYRDSEAVTAWDAEGAKRRNSNTMFHFIIGEPKKGDRAFVEVAFVCDKLTKEVRQLVEDLQTGFLALIANPSFREAA